MILASIHFRYFHFLTLLQIAAFRNQILIWGNSLLLDTENRILGKTVFFMSGRKLCTLL